MADIKPTPAGDEPPVPIEATDPPAQPEASEPDDAPDPVPHERGGRPPLFRH